MTGQIVDLDDPAYFAHPALSHSDTKLLLASPARYRYLKDHPDRPYNPEFEFGHVVHELALGAGAGMVIVDADSWRTKDAKTARDEALADGKAPILRGDYDQARACADAIRLHPLAAKLLDHLDHAEPACIWHDEDYGIDRKAKLDGVCGRFGIDLKTTGDASTEAFGRTAGKYAYASQARWYMDALATCFAIDDPKFLFIVVEKHPPYLTNVIELDPYDIELAARRNQRALEIYRRCCDTNTWPSWPEHTNGIAVAQLPRWAEIEMETM